MTSKVIGSSKTPMVYDIKNLNPNVTPLSKTFFPNIWSGVKKNPNGVIMTPALIGNMMSSYWGSKESSNNINETNKGTRVPPQFTIELDILNIWDDEEESI